MLRLGSGAFSKCWPIRACPKRGCFPGRSCSSGRRRSERRSTITLHEPHCRVAFKAAVANEKSPFRQLSRRRRSLSRLGHDGARAVRREMTIAATIAAPIGQDSESVSIRLTCRLTCRATAPALRLLPMGEAHLIKSRLPRSESGPPSPARLQHSPDSECGTKMCSEAAAHFFVPRIGRPFRSAFDLPPPGC